ncbi:hypothetical protein D3C71_2023880 [compost metagenome]
MLVIGQKRLVQRKQQLLLHHLVDGIVGGDRHVEGGAALGNLRQHGFVGIEGLVDDLDPRFGLKLVQKRRIDIIAPVVDGDGIAAGVALAGVQV